MLIREQKFFLSLALCEEAFWARRRFCFYLFPLRRTPLPPKKISHYLLRLLHWFSFFLLKLLGEWLSFGQVSFWSVVVNPRTGCPWIKCLPLVQSVRGEAGSPVLRMCWGLLHGRGCAWRYLFLVAVCQQIFLTSTLPPGLSPETFKLAIGI